MKALGSIVVKVSEEKLERRSKETYVKKSTVSGQVLSEKALKGSAVSHGMV